MMDFDKKYAASEIDYEWLQEYLSEEVANDIRQFLKPNEHQVGSVKEGVLKISHNLHRHSRTNEVLTDFFLIFMLNNYVYQIIRYDRFTGSVLYLPFNKYDLHEINSL